MGVVVSEQDVMTPWEPTCAEVSGRFGLTALSDLHLVAWTTSRSAERLPDIQA